MNPDPSDGLFICLRLARMAKRDGLHELRIHYLRRALAYRAAMR